MKNLFLGLVVIIMATTSCATLRNTQASVTTRDVTAPVIAATVGDLEVSDQKISYTYKANAKKQKKRGRQKLIFSSVNEIVRLAISEALMAHGDADVLVEPQTTIVRVGKGLKGGIESVTVTGYPAKYKNFRNVDNETLNKAIVSGTLLPSSPSVIMNTKTENKIILQ